VLFHRPTAWPARLQAAIFKDFVEFHTLHLKRTNKSNVVEEIVLFSMVQA